MLHILVILQLVTPGLSSWSTIGEFDSYESCNLAGNILVAGNKESTKMYACLQKTVDNQTKKVIE